MKRKMSLAAAILGAGAAIYMVNKSKSENKNANAFSDAEAECELVPISELISEQKNLELVSRTWLRKWFLDVSDQMTAGKVLLLGIANEKIVNALGYEMDVVLNPSEYLLAEVIEKDTGIVNEVLLINFMKMEAELQQLLEKGEGFVSVSGTQQ